MLICNRTYRFMTWTYICLGRRSHADGSVANPLCSISRLPYSQLSVVHCDARRTGCSVSPTIWRLIHSDVSEISIVSSWALTDVFHCEYQPRRWWISPFSFNLVTDSYRAPWCHSSSPSSCSPREHKSAPAAEYRAAGVKWSLETLRPRRRWSSSAIRVTRHRDPSLRVSLNNTFCQQSNKSDHDSGKKKKNTFSWLNGNRKWKSEDYFRYHKTYLNKSNIF